MPVYVTLCHASDLTVPTIRPIRVYALQTFRDYHSLLVRLPGAGIHAMRRCASELSVRACDLG